MSRRTSGWSAQVESAYHAFGRELWALFYAQCCDNDRAYEAVQEAFVRLQKHDGAAIHNLKGWLLEVGNNWLRDTARQASRAAQATASLDELAGDWQEPVDSLESAETRNRVRAGLRQLRPDDREVLVLRYALGWSSQRMAQALNLTASAVDMRLSRARLRLGTLLEQAGIDHERV
jgi:RNA polymerase sigma-70 factor (ECF subfamily)